MATAHTGNRAFGGATLTSNRAGPVCRWRSLSDFFSASRMNDISSTAVGVGKVEERRVRRCYGAGEHDLRLHARDPIHRKTVLALKIAH